VDEDKFICCQLLLLEYSVHMKWKLYVIRMDHTIPWMPLCTRSFGLWAGRAYKGSCNTRVDFVHLGERALFFFFFLNREHFVNVSFCGEEQCNSLI
jgi:hypothetical protein